MRSNVGFVWGAITGNLLMSSACIIRTELSGMSGQMWMGTVFLGATRIKGEEMKPYVAQFALTVEQLNELAPLFKEAADGADRDEKGLIVSKMRADGIVSAVFIPDEYADRIVNVIKEWWEMVKK
jgi:hypothetical protein